MALTQAQKTALMNDVAADTAFASLPHNGDGAYAVAAAYNQLAAPDFLVWNTAVNPQAVFDAIDWSKFTPSDAADGTAIFTNRILAIQTKQMNLQNMLIGRDIIDASKANIRSGLRDAVIQLPSGAGGALVTAGGSSGVNVLTACTRKATRAEKLLSTGTATTGTVTAALLGFEGYLNPQEVGQAIGWQ